GRLPVKEGATMRSLPAALDGTETLAGELRPDLVDLRTRLSKTTDEGRPEAVAKRRKTGHRTARENIADRVEEGSFVESAALAVAAQRQRYDREELERMSPADGIICGIGSVNRALFDDERARTMVLAYDYTVLAG